jgi:hypothetical protein
MRGKSGHWGNSFTKGNANAMRLRGLETRRFRAEKRLIRALCSSEATEMVRPAQIAGLTDPTFLAFEPVPEPSVLGLLAMGIAAFLVRRSKLIA